MKHVPVLAPVVASPASPVSCTSLEDEDSPSLRLISRSAFIAEQQWCTSASTPQSAGAHVTAKNLSATLLGNKTAVEGGSGKVIDNGPNDHIFIYYADHGSLSVLGMPNMPFVYANDFIEVLKKKHKTGRHKEMVIYIQACECGNIFKVC